MDSFSKRLEGIELMNKVYELIDIPLHERAIICGYFNIQAIANDQEFRLADLNQYFLALLHSIGFPNSMTVIPEIPLRGNKLKRKSDFHQRCHVKKKPSCVATTYSKF